MAVQPQIPGTGQEGPFRAALIVEDHPLFGDALAMTLQSVSGIRHVIHADSLEQASRHLAAGADVDVILLDLNLPDVDGLEGLLHLRRVAPRLPVLLVTSVNETRTIRAALAGGAAGFVPKHSRREVFRAAFEALAAGEVFAPDLPAEAEPEAPHADAVIRRLSQLTRQQARILELICEGRMNKQIAYELSIAETTVKAHVTAIMRKMGVSTRTQAVLMAQDVKLRGRIADAANGAA
ncbi:DNA-binding response regulator [Paracoccus aestuarii]|uniref:DNA-binding response regulator n=1 Tax=Paracoccus aestuarii TaxID=453842 RepID=A0A418ZW16_9RHOB|nr:response regulator transcription factor [Paracoccus aestuarii]RJL04034.1 DNA-binding response regulator [Paracoccus aestuarii]WCR01044.1 response regulator transcription factor [Paracoccus aestuarii]